jgi:N-acetylmuramoyl-L-alanine amidase
MVLDITNELGRYIEKNHPNIKVIYTRTDDTFLGLRDRTNIANENKGQIFISVHANASTAKSARGFEIFLLGPNSVDEAMEVTLRENASIAFEDNQEQYKLENQIIASLSQTTFLKESEKLALFIENNVKKELPKTRMRGIKQAGFHVLVGASMPNLLVEVGFISNKSEAKLLNKSSYRRQMARGIFNGISDYIEYYEKKYN